MRSAASADTVQETCSESDDMLECIDSANGSETSDPGPSRLLPKYVFDRFTSFFIGRPVVHMSVAARTGSGLGLLMASQSDVLGVFVQVWPKAVSS